jgi:foldase protein PrsA
MENEANKEEVITSVESNDANKKQPAIISTRNAAILSGVIVALALVFVCKSIFVAAVVNGSPISRYAVVHEAEKRAGKATLDSMIMQKILADEVRKKGVTVSESDISAEIQSIEQRFAAQGSTLDAMLAAQGMTRDDVKKQIVTQLQVQKLLGDKVAVSEAEIDQFIATNKISVPSGCSP